MNTIWKLLHDCFSEPIVLLFSPGKDYIISESEDYKKTSTQPFNPDYRILDSCLCSFCLNTSSGSWLSLLKTIIAIFGPVCIPTLTHCNMMSEYEVRKK